MGAKGGKLNIKDLAQLRDILSELIALQAREIDALDDYPEIADESICTDGGEDGELADVFSLMEIKEKLEALIENNNKGKSKYIIWQE